jgi:hypothetical protein
MRGQRTPEEVSTADNDQRLHARIRYRKNLVGHTLKRSRVQTNRLATGHRGPAELDDDPAISHAASGTVAQGSAPTAPCTDLGTLVWVGAAPHASKRKRRSVSLLPISRSPPLLIVLYPAVCLAPDKSCQYHGE